MKNYKAMLMCTLLVSFLISGCSNNPITEDVSGKYLVEYVATNKTGRGIKGVVDMTIPGPMTPELRDGVVKWIQNETGFENVTVTSFSKFQ